LIKLLYLELENLKDIRSQITNLMYPLTALMLGFLVGILSFVTNVLVAAIGGILFLFLFTLIYSLIFIKPVSNKIGRLIRIIGLLEIVSVNVSRNVESKLITKVDNVIEKYYSLSLQDKKFKSKVHGDFLEYFEEQLLLVITKLSPI